MATETIDINPRDVIVKNRIRKDLGDTTTLMVSMEKEGQLQAIGIDSENNLIFGERRLDAAIRAGWETIRATRFDDKADAAKAMAAEFAENTERKEFAPLELREAAKRLEASLKPAAIAKREENLKRGDTPPKKERPEMPKLATSGKSRAKPQKSPDKTREIVAAAFGKSPETIRKIDVVATAAEQPDAPVEVKAAAEEMNRTGKVDPAFKAVQAATNPPDDGERLRSTLLTRLDVVRDIHALCDSPAGKNVKQAKALKAHGELVAAIKGEKPVLDPIAEIELPKPLDTPQFRDKWREWCLYRRKRKPAVSADAARKTFNKLIKVPLASAMQAIDDAISNDWRGIFPERSKPRKSVIGPGQTYDPHAAEKDPDHGKL